MQQLDDRLAEHVAAGDRMALAQLVDQHHARIYRHACRIVRDGPLAEDIAQDVFLKLCSGAARFDASRGALLPWLLRITTNAALDAKRALKPVSDLSQATDVADPRANPHASAESNAVHRVIAQLPPRQRAAIALFYLEGFSMSEVADTLGTNSKAIEGLLSRGKIALQAALNPDAQKGCAA
jgi:RNA polymerase sigma-70 factor, ECF subfamily